MIRSIALTCLFIALVNGQTTDVSRCIVHQGDLPYQTYIEGCTSTPCSLPQLQNAVVNIVFRVPYTIRQMRTLATAYLLVIPIPHDLAENANTCNFLQNTYCPVLGGEVVQYTLNMFIQPSFPVGTSATIEFRIVDDNNQPFICIRVPIRITAPLSKNLLHQNNTTLTIDV